MIICWCRYLLKINNKKLTGFSVLKFKDCNRRFWDKDSATLYFTPKMRSRSWRLSNRLCLLKDQINLVYISCLSITERNYVTIRQYQSITESLLYTLSVQMYISRFLFRFNSLRYLSETRADLQLLNQYILYSILVYQ